MSREAVRSDHLFEAGIRVDESNTKRLVAAWLKVRLTERSPEMTVHVFESRRTRLSQLIDHLSLQGLFPEWKAWDVKVDVTGIVHGKREGYVALVDFQTKKVTLDDVARLLGYAKTVNPILCMVLSREGPADALITLLQDYGRHDVLQYGREIRHIRIGQWDDVRREVIPMSVIPRGSWL